MSPLLITLIALAAAVLLVCICRARRRGQERSERLRRMVEESEAEMKTSQARWNRAFGNWRLEHNRLKEARQ